jgi:hypothetical protein
MLWWCSHVMTLVQKLQRVANYRKEQEFVYHKALSAESIQCAWCNVTKQQEMLHTKFLLFFAFVPCRHHLDIITVLFIHQLMHQ